jgi:hypothetical protein
MNQNKNITVDWPTTPFFSLNDLIAANPGRKVSTLTARLQKERDAYKITDIGNFTGEQGRPRKIFAFVPVPESTFELAESQQIQVDREKANGKPKAPISLVSIFAKKPMMV